MGQEEKEKYEEEEKEKKDLSLDLIVDPHWTKNLKRNFLLQ